MKKTVIIIAGPTASGKTSLSLQLAKHFSTEIVSADSRQCYRELNVGVAKPTAAELGEVPHHFINSHSITDSISAADYERYALDCAAKLFEQHDVIVMVGGTGLYIKAFCEGLDDIPAVAESIVTETEGQYKVGGLAWLQQAVQEADPIYFAGGEIHNPQRMLRALQVKLSSGQSITSFQNRQPKQRSFNVVKIGLNMLRPVLYNRINKRVDEMIAQGLEAEAASLLPYKQLNALQTVGYREFFDFFEGRISRDQAIERIKHNTRHYAKRQVTWFKRDGAMHWINALHPQQALKDIFQLMESNGANQV